MIARDQSQHTPHRLVATAGIGVLVIYLSSPAMVVAMVPDGIRDRFAAYRHHIVRLSWPYLHGTGPLGFVLVAELVGAVAFLVLVVGWADRRGCRGRRGEHPGRTGPPEPRRQEKQR